MAELLVCIDKDLIEINVTHERDGGFPNPGWESAGWFPSIHDALTEGKLWLDMGKDMGLKRGARSRPRYWLQAA
jgi:hypothetical protein